MLPEGVAASAAAPIQACATAIVGNGNISIVESMLSPTASNRNGAGALLLPLAAAPSRAGEDHDLPAGSTLACEASSRQRGA